MNTCAQSKPAEAKLRATVPPRQRLCLQLCVIAVYLKTFHSHREGLKLSGAINVKWWQTQRQLPTAREKIKRFPLRNKHLVQRNLWMNKCFTVTPQTQPNKGFCKFDQLTFKYSHPPRKFSSYVSYCCQMCLCMHTKPVAGCEASVSHPGLPFPSFSWHFFPNWHFCQREKKRQRLFPFPEVMQVNWGINQKANGRSDLWTGRPSSLAFICLQESTALSCTSAWEQRSLCRIYWN